MGWNYGSQSTDQSINQSINQLLYYYRILSLIRWQNNTCNTFFLNVENIYMIDVKKKQKKNDIKCVTDCAAM